MTLSDWIAAWGSHMPPQAVADLQAAINPVQPTGTGDASEARVASDVRLAASRAGVALWRNNSGAMTDAESGRLVRFGLGNESAAINSRWKSSDLIGIAPGGRFVAVETKRPGWKLTPGDKRGQAQAAFIQSVQGLGGLAGFASGADDLERILK